MESLIKVITIIYAGVLPIVYSCYSRYVMIWWLCFGNYPDSCSYLCLANDTIIYITALLLSISNNYCRYHSLMIMAELAQIGVSCYIASTMSFILIGNLTIIAINIFSLVMMLIVFKHIYDLSTKHIQKIKILIYGVLKGINRDNRRTA